MNYIRLNLGITKIYLVPCQEGYLLIDTGYEKDYEKFVKLMKREKIKIEAIKYLLITHYHDDHAGFARKLKEEYGIPLIVQAASVPLLLHGNSDGLEDEYAITKRVKFIFSLFSVFHKDFKYPPVIIDDKDIIVDGDDSKVLRRLGIKADIIFTPGHTSDSMSVLGDDGTLFSGDMCMNFMNVLGASYRPIYYNDLNQVYESIHRVIKRGAETIVPSHGNYYSVTKLKKALEKHGQVPDVAR